jgi:hypothetical protein
MSRQTGRVGRDEARGPVSWVSVALFVLGGITLLLALASALMIAYTWATDGIGA